MKCSLNILVILVLIGGAGSITGTTGTAFQSEWPKRVESTWIGPDYWANRLQDWRVAKGRLECIFIGPNRNVNILTRQLSARKGNLNMSVRLGIPGGGYGSSPGAWVGFRIGIKGEFNDYRDSAVHGTGLDMGVTASGKLFIGKISSTVSTSLQPYLEKGFELRTAVRLTGDTYSIELTAFAADSGRELFRVKRRKLPPGKLVGNLALVSHFPGATSFNKNTSAWFSDWRISGSKVDIREEQAFGPVLWSQYTLSKGLLKMTAQMPPLGKRYSQEVKLEVRRVNGEWRTIGKAKIDDFSRTALFRVENWDDGVDIPYRLVYALMAPDETTSDHYYYGTVRKDPVDKAEIVVAAFTGNNDLGFPNNDIFNGVRRSDPDLLFFSGDQIYEGVGGFGVQREPLDMACLDYLRKWYLYGWVWRELMRDRPVISIPDDHDVYHGNIWGCGGKAAIKEGTGADRQDSGGYKMPALWVNMVQRTQTAHLPDPFDASPVKQGITVYYCDMSYGGISFAVLEDRKFKSAPKELLPEAGIWNGWPQNRTFNAIKDADAPEAVLLGERQLSFLNHWAADWGHGTWMKVVLSQTIFADVATLPVGEKSGSNIPKLRILPAGAYAENDRPVSDFDSNGWPRTGRDKAIIIMRRAFAFHIAGDQHLGSTIQYGVDDWKDAGFAFCVPSISNIWPRRWYPSESGGNRKPGSPKYTGDFEDGFGNKMTVYAVSNPVYTGKKPARLYDRAAGFGIVRFNRSSRDIVIECWPRGSEPANPGSAQYPDWPVRLNQLENYDRKAAAWLPTIEVSGKKNPIVRVIDESNGEIVYTLRIKGTSFRPRVFREGVYTVRVGDKKLKTFTGIKSISKDNKELLRVAL